LNELCTPRVRSFKVQHVADHDAVKGAIAKIAAGKKIAAQAITAPIIPQRPHYAGIYFHRNLNAVPVNAMGTFGSSFSSANPILTNGTDDCGCSVRYG
jgi:hypothetical protein